MAMTNTHIESSIMKWLEDTLGKSAVSSPIEIEDVVADNVDSWLEAHLTALRPTPQRRSQPLIYNHRLTVHCSARTSNDVYAASRLADEVASLVDRANIPVYDYSTVTPTQVGVAKFEEPQVYDTTENLPTGDSKWQSRRVQIDVTCEAL